MNNLALFASIVFFCASTVTAQDKPAAAPAAASAPKHYYRLNYVLKEWDEGKVINQRAYTLPTTARADTLTLSTTAGDEWTRLRAGTRLGLQTQDAPEAGGCRPSLRWILERKRRLRRVLQRDPEAFQQIDEKDGLEEVDYGLHKCSLG